MRCGGAQGGSVGCGPCTGMFLQPPQRPPARCCRQSAAWQPWVTTQHAGLCPRQHVRRRRAVRARQSSIAPNMPLPGDDQAAVVFSALSELDGAADAAAGALRREFACASCPACHHTGAGQACLVVPPWCGRSMCRQGLSPGARFCAYGGHRNTSCVVPCRAEASPAARRAAATGRAPACGRPSQRPAPRAAAAAAAAATARGRRRSRRACRTAGGS